MKKIISLLLILVSVLLVGCTSSNVIENISVDELREILDEDYTFLDVRTIEEYNEFHIDEFSNLDYYQFSKDNSMLDPLDKDKPIVLICRSGNRSSEAAKILEELGFSKIFNVTGGMNTW